MKMARNNSTLIDLQRQRVARWLVEWKLDQLLSRELVQHLKELPTSGMQHVAIRGELSYADAAKPIRVGEIRLLHPTGDDSNERPLYFAVLDKQPDHMFLIAPFGCFAEPALPGEWLTGLKAMPLRVLCLWNSRVVGKAMLSQSWRAGRMTTEKVWQAMDVYDHVKAKRPLSSVSPKDIGPPVKHPLDPRLQYQMEEANFLEENLAASLRHRPNAIYETQDSELRIAAESQEPYVCAPRRQKREAKHRTRPH